MFNSLCFYLVRLGLSRQVAWVRRWMQSHARATYRQYDNPKRVGYQGWFETPHLGAIAFLRPDGSIQYEW